MMRPSISFRLLAAAVFASAAIPDRAAAQLDDYIGDIFPVAFTFCPRGSVEAGGQLMAIAMNTALFSLYGTTFGGDGRTTFGLPDLRGRTPIHAGTGPGLAPRQSGSEQGAVEQILTVGQIPNHSHAVRANNLDGDLPGPGGKLLAAAPTGGTGNETIYSTQPPTVTMSDQMISPEGGGQPIATIDPTIVIRYCIATVGIYPQRP
ncbi:phage tail protein [Jannaschia formosa]|uniref:phage tail protein n=1 Tax=Jannaschia formosa TaxID=2259592 RepID=UPI000E1B6CC4|nr:tail fiber protein [Jannaschia formosa]TFL16832.1 phage tail protein [Jannaschia formosa]